MLEVILLDLSLSLPKASVTPAGMQSHWGSWVGGGFPQIELRGGKWRERGVNTSRWKKQMPSLTAPISPSPQLTLLQSSLTLSLPPTPTLPSLETVHADLQNLCFLPRNYLSNLPRRPEWVMYSANATDLQDSLRSATS